MSFDFIREQLDPDAESPKTTKELVECARCTRQRWIEDTVKVGERYLCKGSCYDPPIGEGKWRRGDE